MYYEPKHFRAEEVFPRSIVELEEGNAIWRRMDARTLWTADQLRDRFGTAVCNTYFWGGKSSYRGFRPVLDLMNWSAWERGEGFKPIFSSFTSQHCFGRALDLVFIKVTAEEIREDIRNNLNLDCYKYITCVERHVTWLHFDIRNWVSRILWVDG